MGNQCVRIASLSLLYNNPEYNGHKGGNLCFVNPQLYVINSYLPSLHIAANTLNDQIFGVC